jgi:hypothetical protein
VHMQAAHRQPRRSHHRPRRRRSHLQVLLPRARARPAPARQQGHGADSHSQKRLAYHPDPRRRGGGLPPAALARHQYLRLR